MMCGATNCLTICTLQRSIHFLPFLTPTSTPQENRRSLKNEMRSCVSTFFILFGQLNNLKECTPPQRVKNSITCDYDSSPNKDTALRLTGCTNKQCANTMPYPNHKSTQSNKKIKITSGGERERE